MLKRVARLSALLGIFTFGLFWSGEVMAQKKVRVAYPSSVDMGDIPSLLAWEQLKKQGIEIVPHYFPKPIWPFRRCLPGKPTSARRPASP